jgi:hypothetical protein
VDTAKPAKRELWLCGKPKFIREALENVLAHELEGVNLQSITDQEPPDLHLTSNVLWLVWFMNGTSHDSADLVRAARSTGVPNVLVIQNNGNAWVFRSDHSTQSQRNVSLMQVLDLLKQDFQSADNLLPVERTLQA